MITSTNNKMKMKYLVCILCVFLVKTCEFPDMGYFFRMSNNANHKISYFVDEQYPDTSITKNKPNLRILEPMETWQNTYRGTLEERFSKIEKVSIFIFHPDTLNKYTWEEVRESYNILKRYDLSLEDWQNLKSGIVTYPPTEAMKNIEQYPPYGSE